MHDSKVPGENMTDSQNIQVPLAYANQGRGRVLLQITTYKVNPIPMPGVSGGNGHTEGLKTYEIFFKFQRAI